jgi:hypothetical protein
MITIYLITKKIMHSNKLIPKRKIILLSFFVLLTAGLIAFAVNKNAIDDQIVSYTVDTKPATFLERRKRRNTEKFSKFKAVRRA